jgi:O-acetyl-ADP-ribose deacetylase (regulator of RNase III)
MTDKLQINDRSIRLIKGDVTDLEIDAFVYYAQHNLNLGAGYGTSISVRGGPTIQEELKQFGTLETTEAVISAAGEMKAKFIVHAVGPRFQEEDLEKKLAATIQNTLKAADEKGVRNIAFPAMGAGFYGVPLDVSARVTLESIAEFLSRDTHIERVTVCLLDAREYIPYEKHLSMMAKGFKEVQ